MSKTFRITMGLIVVSSAVACSRPQPEPVYVEPAPIVSEPVYSKY